MDDNSFLGRGWSFPPEFNNNTGSVLMLEDIDDIYSSLQILLTTATGERIMQPGYGCDMQEFLFEPMDTGMQTLMMEKIDTAVLFYEPRIKVDTLELDTSNIWAGVVFIKLNFIVKTSNSRFNFVFPFYLQEGTEIQGLLYQTSNTNDTL
ncbi:GPW/gp25 family protein [Chitinophaga sp. Cy-1792]|uniref:GPW/gp25 family protein n=1 Tax=Chitinophaga sp. Cy-1792 TaxID=2608339 RepID=UPI00141F77CA|nr:GPW/gp25 family protein [Chitinophaga sp. Cy-1792]NIG53824.1 GPW/gp25 family protein [Chitinophaga sp. Cy-1792]